MTRDTRIAVLLMLVCSAIAQRKQAPAPPKFAPFPAAAKADAITEAKFVSAEQANKFLKPDEPVIGIMLGSEARAYSLWQVERHFVVNDRIAGRAVAVTWCPLSHSAAVYAREAGGRELTFQPDGRVLHDTLLLRDAETGSVWAQIDGTAIEGPQAGSRLPPIAAVQTTWAAWKKEQPATIALEKAGEAITSTQYAEYDADPRKMGLGNVALNVPRMGGKALVVALVSGEDRVAIPLDRLKRDIIISLVADRQAVAAIYDPETNTARVVRREARGRTLSLRRGFGDIFGRPTAPYLVDQESASRWDLSGRAISGHMEGHRLPPFPHRVLYWYAWQAYFPNGRVEGF